MGDLILRALKERGRLTEARAEIVTCGLTGGPAALVPRSVVARLVTVLDSGAAAPATWTVQSWLERRQARRSALVVAPDRPTAVSAALRFKLDVSRIRIESDPMAPDAQARLRRELSHGPSNGRAWHSAPR